MSLTESRLYCKDQVVGLEVWQELVSDVESEALLWLKSYLSERTQMVICGDTRSPWVLGKYGVPQCQSWVLSFTSYIQPTNLQTHIFCVAMISNPDNFIDISALDH